MLGGWTRWKLDVVACDAASVLNPAQFRLLLAGPRVARLHPFVTARGYVCDAATSGEEALEAMRAAPRHVLLVELELHDMLLADLLQTVRAENLAGAVILLEDPAKSGLIVSTLVRGVDGYVATPPDENFLFRMIERQLLAQWALAQEMLGKQGDQDKMRLEKQVQQERAKVLELVKEIAALREELAARPLRSGEGAAMRSRSGEGAPTRAVSGEGPTKSREVPLRTSKQAAFDRTHDDESPSLRPKPPPPPSRDRPLAKKRIPGFDDDDIPKTNAGGDEDSDLFLELDERTSDVQLPPKKPAGAGNTLVDDDRFLLEDD
jgi:ActR/RegA family two-component response regulator